MEALVSFETSALALLFAAASSRASCLRARDLAFLESLPGRTLVGVEGGLSPFLLFEGCSSSFIFGFPLKADQPRCLMRVNVTQIELLEIPRKRRVKMHLRQGKEEQEW